MEDGAGWRVVGDAGFWMVEGGVGCWKVKLDAGWRPVYSRLDVGMDPQQLAEGHAEALVEVMVDAAARLHPLCVPLQQVQDQRAEVAGNQKGVVFLQQQPGQAAQDALPVLLVPYLRTTRRFRVIKK